MHNEVSIDKAHSQRETTLEPNPEGYTGVSQAEKGILGRLHSMERWGVESPAALPEDLQKVARGCRSKKDDKGWRGRKRSGQEGP